MHLDRTRRCGSKCAVGAFCRAKFLLFFLNPTSRLYRISFRRRRATRSSRNDGGSDHEKFPPIIKARFCFHRLVDARSPPTPATSTASASSSSVSTTKTSCARASKAVVSSIAAGTHGVPVKSSAAKSISSADIRRNPVVTYSVATYTARLNTCIRTSTDSA